MLSATIYKIAQILVTSLLLVDVINEWRHLYAYVKKWIIVVRNKMA